jgi:small subunit ribosomal protein YMR-31
LQRSFADFLKKFETSCTTIKKSSEDGRKQAFGEFWEAPARFWRPRVRELEDGEIDAVLSGGASLR